jgi:hypothetical protein
VNRKNRTAYRYKDFVLYKLQRKLLVPMPLQILPTISLTLIFLLALQNTILLHYHRFLGYTPYHSEVHLLIGMNIYDTMLDLNKRYHNSQVPRVEQELLIRNYWGKGELANSKKTKPSIHSSSVDN